mgnify:CR=1 FL=1
MSSTTSTERDPAKRVKFFDTSLRDGEQAPGIHLNQREKVEIGQQLARQERIVRAQPVTGTSRGHYRLARGGRRLPDLRA